MKTIRLPILILAGAAPLANATITTTNSWSLGEGATIGTDSVGASPFNNVANTTIGTASLSGVAGSTAYASVINGSGSDGLWMFGAGSTAVTIPAQDWGFQVMVRSTGSLAVNQFQSVFGFKDASSGGLAVEAKNLGGTVYWQVNQPGISNLINPQNASVTVSTNTWTNLALVRNGANLEFYVNKTLVGSSTGTYSTDGLIALGLQQGVGANNFVGDFDEARFFTFTTGQFDAASDLYSAAAIPEPSTYGLMGAGALAGVALVRRRRRA